MTNDNDITFYCGDSRSVIPKLEDNSVDMLCTDPPYGISFMGKSWDKALPDINIWKECLRVMKPGAFAFVLCSPRQDVLSCQINNLREAGFDVGFTSIYWTHFQGFPKAMSISKAVDKRLNGLNTQDYAVYTKEKPEVGTQDASGRFVVEYTKGVGVSKEDNQFGGINRGAAGVKQTPCWIPVYGREVIGSRHTRAGVTDTNIFTTKVPDVEITIPSTPQAKELDGAYAGYQPKPCLEVVIVAMKPLSEKTYLAQAMKDGKGVTWLDRGRIPTDNQWTQSKGTAWSPEKHWGEDCVRQSDDRGRFAPNLLVSDNVLDDGRISESSPYSHRAKQAFPGQWDTNDAENTPQGYSDKGSNSRFFSLDAWWAKTFPFLVVSKPSKTEKNMGTQGNRHPTVKPIQLMTYLVSVGSRPGDMVLDPFVGSGTTAIACQSTGRRCIGIDSNPDYIVMSIERTEVE